MKSLKKLLYKPYWTALRNLTPFKTISELTYFVTPRCNFRCKHCFNWQAIKGAETNTQLTSAQLATFASSLPDLLSLLLTGGEPFLTTNLADICHILYRSCNVNYISIPTNASLPSLTSEVVEKILRLCPRAIITISPSLDHIGKKRDEFVGYKDSFDLFRTVYYELIELYNRYPNLMINVITTFNKDNQEDIDEIVRYVTDELHPPSYAVNLVRGIMPDGTRQSSLDIDKYQATVGIVEDYNLKRNGLKFDGSKLYMHLRQMLRDIVIKTYKTVQYQMPCHSGKVRLVLNSYGTIAPCEPFLLEKTECSFGNIGDFDYDFKKLIRSPQFINIVGSIKKTRCFCHSECDYLYNILFNFNTLLKLVMTAYMQRATNTTRR